MSRVVLPKTGFEESQVYVVIEKQETPQGFRVICVTPDYATARSYEAPNRFIEGPTPYLKPVKVSIPGKPPSPTFPDPFKRSTEMPSPFVGPPKVDVRSPSLKDPGFMDMDLTLDPKLAATLDPLHHRTTELPQPVVGNPSIDILPPNLGAPGFGSDLS